MATYTTNYKFALPVPNSPVDSNTWGSTLNTSTITRMDNYLLNTALSNIGNSAPTVPSGSPMAGQSWIDNLSIAPNLSLNIYDGATWVQTGVINTTTHTYTPANGAVPTLDGQVVIGSTGQPPVAATLTAGSGISITNGAGAITIAASIATSVNVQTFFSNGTYTPTPGMFAAVVRLIGGGAGGGGNGAGGGAGEYREGFFSASTTTATIEIGGQGVPSGNGGSTIFTGNIFTIICVGGATPTGSGSSGGDISFAYAGLGGGFPGSPTGTGTGGYFTTPGQNGGIGMNFGSSNGFANMGGYGASSLFGSGGWAVGTAKGSGGGTGISASGYGAGGAGGTNGGAGGSGSPGIVIITEYIG
jgi:hypothetical protein